MPPHATSTFTVPNCGTSTLASRCTAKAGTLRNVTRVTLPSWHSARIPTSPAGASRMNSVTGLGIGVGGRQDDVGAQGRVAARLAQHAQADFIPVFLEVFHLLEHAAAGD